MKTDRDAPIGVFDSGPRKIGFWLAEVLDW